MAARKGSKQRLFLLVSLILFGGSTVAGALRLYSTAAVEPAQAETQTTDPIQEQIRGYQAVLQREPENQVALEGLVQARLELHDIKGTIPPLQKLVQLNPDRSDYKKLLAQAKQAN